MSTRYVRFGSTAAPRYPTSPAAAMEREPAARCSIFDSKILNACFSRERSFNVSEFQLYEGQKTADTVEKLGLTMTGQFIGIFRLLGARITDRL